MEIFEMIFLVFTVAVSRNPSFRWEYVRKFIIIEFIDTMKITQKGSNFMVWGYTYYTDDIIFLGVLLSATIIGCPYQQRYKYWKLKF